MEKHYLTGTWIFKLLAAFFVAALLFFLSAGRQIRYAQHDVEALPFDGTLGAVTDVRTVEQSFIYDGDYLHTVCVQIGTYARENTGLLHVAFKDAAGGVLWKSKYDIAQMEDNAWLVMEMGIRLPKDSESPKAGGRYRLEFWSEGCYEDNAVTLYTGTAEYEKETILTVGGEQAAAGRQLVMAVSGGRERAGARFYWLYVCLAAGGILLFYANQKKQEQAGRKCMLHTVGKTLDTYRFLVKQLVSRDFKTKYKRSVLGAFETPVVQACIPQMLSGDNIIRGNAVVNQAASISYLTGPLLGGILYAAFGLKLVMYASVVCFFVTALLECFIKLRFRPRDYQGNILSMARDDFLSSVRFIGKERTDIMKMLILAALSRFFVMGVTLVGFPFIVRTILGLDAKYYGGAESMLAAAAILGSIAAGLLTGKLKFGRQYLMLAAIGACMIPAGAVFLFSLGAVVRYAVNTAAFCGMQAAISMFSIYAVSKIQQNTPDHLLGKVMAYTSAITMCTQPIGQVVYGFLFDRFREAVWLVLIPSGVVVCVIGAASAGFFRRLDEKQGDGVGNPQAGD